MQNVGAAQSAFGFYKSEKAKAGLTSPAARKIKGKYNDLVNKKKNKKQIANGSVAKKKGQGVKNNAVVKANGKALADDWSVRKKQFDQLSNGQTKAKRQEFDEDSRSAGQKVFQHLINPMDVEKFMSKYWEKKPMLISRQEDRKYYADLLSMAEINSAINKDHVEYTTNVDVTSYKDGQRTTLNPDGRANASELWDFYNEGCSVRFLNPHLFFPEIYRLNSTLQEYFSCMVGANVYLTPPNSQGFAPHYDDIEAFVLQVEGKKHWRVYAPRNPEEVLPRVSSPNYSQAEIGEVILDVVLEPGDLLYFPRGFIHQANTVPGHHSLHITLSTYQKNSWADFMEACVKGALSEAIRSDVEFRKGIPLNMSQHLGAVHAYSSDEASADRKMMMKRVRSLYAKIGEFLAIDEAADELQKKFQHDALPPKLSDMELQRNARGAKLQTSGGVVGKVDEQFTETTGFRLLKANIATLVVEEGETRLYYHLDNSKYYHQYEPVFLEVDPDSAPAISALIKSYPNYLKPKEVEGDALSTLTIYRELWNRGLLVTKDVVTQK